MQRRTMVRLSVAGIVALMLLEASFGHEIIHKLGTIAFSAMEYLLFVMMVTLIGFNDDSNSGRAWIRKVHHWLDRDTHPS